MAGRPSKLTFEVIDGLAEAIRLGMPYALACHQVGIAYRTFNDWDNGRFPKYASIELRSLFSQSIKRAEAEALYEALLVIKRASLGQCLNNADWKAAAWFVEKRYPQYFGRRSAKRTSARRAGGST